MTSGAALFTVAQIRAIEKAAYASLAPGTLMERAGQAACDAALALLPAMRNIAPVLVLAGPGNNGGDALDAAARLAAHGLPVTVMLHADPAKQPADARQAFARAQNSMVRFADASSGVIPATSWALVIDGLFGIGLQRPISEPLRSLVHAVNQLPCPVLALDVPSGLDADTGTIVGPDGVAVRASHTVTFIGGKPGLHTAHGRDLAGSVQVAALGVDPCLFPPAAAQLNRPELFAHALRPRLHDSHKGSYGEVAVLGGAHGMAGAVLLAARAALHAGAGRVLAGFLEQPLPLDPLHPELMCRAAASIDLAKPVVVAGPGLGISSTARDLLLAVLAAPGSIVLDADGLNLLAAESSLLQCLRQRRPATVLTPHPLEAARLLGTSTSAVQANRPAAAQQLARQLNAIVVLKGSGSIIARPEGDIVINGTGNPGLATAGSGDVLAGICGALLAQGLPAWETALAAVWLHGAAADTLVARGIGPIGMTAGELIRCVRQIFNQLTSRHARHNAVN